MNFDEINEFLNKYATFYSDESESSNSIEESDKSNSKENGSSNYNYGFFYTNKNGFGCNDMPGGFQRINPMLFIVIGDIIGDLMSGNLPFNVQNAVGNWIQLVGQAIETYSGQQQYFQSGPGRYYSPENLNVSNPLCPEASSENSTSSNDNNENNERSEDYVKAIQCLYTAIKDMENELDGLKSRIDTMEKNKDDFSNITE